ncbi:MAG TPA: DUF2760 domain-containing protein [Polyangiaceae bacterium]|nr:DUF2760 domain-containing protein [Polyangiaceae bacterium]
MSLPSLSLASRLWLSWVCAFRVLFDGQFAARVAALREAGPEPDALPAPSAASAPAKAVPVAAPSVAAQPSASTGALQLLSLLQREGRFIDFIEQDVAAFGDADIGAAARLVHDGCRRALRAHASVVSVRSEAEGSSIVLQSASPDVKLVGNVAGAAPFRGVLRHRGWRVEQLTLPTLLGSHDPKLLAAAELELS